MIQVDKDFANVPESLNSKTTNNKRLQIIAHRIYPKKKKSADARYKTKDIKEELEKIYHGKCAFCEKSIEEYDIEHYRPKSVYYWLAYSWDNLMMSCKTCNISKSKNFQTGNQAIKEPEAIDFLDIHSLGSKYNEIEKPLLLNPENSKDSQHFENFIFDETGKISFFNHDQRCEFTIKICKLDRKQLNARRYKIIERFEKLIFDIELSTIPDDVKLIQKKAVLKTFITDAYNKESDFLSFRRFVIHNFIEEML